MDKLKAVNKAITIQIRKDLRKEAKEMVALAPEIMLDELLELHAKDNGNIFCLCLDVIKRDLVEAGTVKDTDFPSFGHPFDTL